MIFIFLYDFYKMELSTFYNVIKSGIIIFILIITIATILLILHKKRNIGKNKKPIPSYILYGLSSLIIISLVILTITQISNMRSTPEIISRRRI